MRKRVDITGNRYSRLVVLGFSHAQSSPRGSKTYWLCQCDCGGEKTVRQDALKSGATSSCGCLHREAVSTHGMTKTKTFSVWTSMRDRCRNPRNDRYHRYGGRGISLCNEWDSFDQFLIDMGEAPDGLQIDRIDNNGNYCPENCRWVTVQENLANRGY